MLQETLTVRAPAGFRTFSTDTFHLDADDCGYDYRVKLTALPTNFLGEDVTEGVWTDKGVKIYLSKVPAPGDDFTNATDWDQDPLIVDDTGTVLNVDKETGIAPLLDNSNLVVGFELVGGSPAAAQGTLRFQVNFAPAP